MGYIYKIINDVNDLIYIGQTKKTVDYRFKEHIRQAKYELEQQRPITYLHSAINKYGAEHFSVQTIEQCDNEKLNEREIYWISHYNSYNNGYNSTLGGQSSKNSGGWNRQGGKQVLQYDLNGNFIQIFTSATSAAKANNLDATYIRLACNPNTPNKTAGGFQWRYYEENYPIQIEIVSGRSGRKSKPINQYDLKGNYIQTYNSLQDAAAATNQTIRNIKFACDKKQKRAGDFQWRYEDDINLPSNLIAERLSKYCNPLVPIEQLDKNNKLIKTWKSIIDAAEILNIDAKKIGLVCEKQHRSYKNFKWQYKN